MQINSSNVTILTGWVVGNPILRHTKKERPVTSFLVRTVIDRKNKNGEPIRVNVSCTAWDQVAKKIIVADNQKLLILGQVDVEKINDKYRQYIKVTDVQVVSEVM
ncbi:single-stranded DNA-binding protein [Liquorilactobacillus hordei]|uniref:single-stranded DNA-binding protein n=1 Tax=Liquorilactobacillus hordei TaxID=468911 RepID=UPI001CBC0C05|nr:single-stranded DNA-binding protein [Liquorilactobacillus hordei]MBZ2406627.1 hypothetical protein [Liquorilactobacillus hordei]